MPDPINNNNESLLNNNGEQNGSNPNAAAGAQNGENAQQPHEDKTRFQARIDQLTAARRAAEERARILEEQVREYEAAREARVNAPQPGMGVRPGQKVEMVGQMTREDWNEWHGEDPAAAIEYMADFKAEQKAKHVMSQIERATRVESTVNEVYKAHPELKEVMEGKKRPEEVPFWGVFDEVAREMPEAQHMARGPFLVMKEAERRIKERELAENERKIAEEAAAAENNRQQRVGASYTLGSQSSAPSSKTVKLNPEQERIARKMGLTPEEYAKELGGK